MCRKLWFAAVGLGAFVGCGDSKESAEDRLQGSWYIESTEFECTTVLTIKGDLFELKELCELEDHSIGLELHDARFTLNGDRIDVGSLVATTCKERELRPETPTSFRYKLVGESLSLTTPEGVRVFERVDDDDANNANAEITFGCFDEDDNFEASPVARL